MSKRKQYSIHFKSNIIKEVYDGLLSFDINDFANKPSENLC